MRRREERRPASIAEAAMAAALEFPNGQCLVCGKAARTFSSSEVPELIAFMRGDIGDQDLAAAAWRAFPGREGCLVAPLSGFSVCATKGVAR